MLNEGEANKIRLTLLSVMSKFFQYFLKTKILHLLCFNQVQ